MVPGNGSRGSRCPRQKPGEQVCSKARSREYYDLRAEKRPAPAKVRRCQPFDAAGGVGRRESQGRTASTPQRRPAAALSNRSPARSPALSRSAEEQVCLPQRQPTCLRYRRGVQSSTTGLVTGWASRRKSHDSADPLPLRPERRPVLSPPGFKCWRRAAQHAVRVRIVITQ